VNYTQHEVIFHGTGSSTPTIDEFENFGKICEFLQILKLQDTNSRSKSQVNMTFDGAAPTYRGNLHDCVPVKNVRCRKNWRE